MTTTALPIGLPTGTSDFGKVMRLVHEDPSTIYVDKTLFIKEIFEDKLSDVILITRPRRFGKTLNLSMLHHFLASEVSGQFTCSLFLVAFVSPSWRKTVDLNR